MNTNTNPSPNPFAGIENPIIKKEIRKRQPIPTQLQNQAPQFYPQSPQTQAPNQQPKQDSPNEDEDKKKKKKKRKKLSLLALLLLLLLLLSYSCSRFIPVDKLPIPGLNFDPNQGIEDLTHKSKDEIIAALNQKVEEGMINISMNTNPVFENGKSEGNLRIDNIEANRYPQLVEIYTKDDNTLLYSGAVDIGLKVNYSTLLVDLPKGDYECIAYFHAINPETNERIGTAGANIKITIQN